MRRGFRWRWLARLTNGRVGLGRWTSEEIERIRDKAADDSREMRKHID